MTVVHSSLTGSELHVPGYNQAGDPGAVGASKQWIDTTLGTGLWKLKIRNAADGAWETIYDPAAGTFTGVLNVTEATSGGDTALQLGLARAASGNSYIDFIGDTTYTDYGLRILRLNSGANAESQVYHRGTGGLRIRTADAAPMYLDTNALTRLTIAADGTFTIAQALDHDGSTWGMFGTTPAARGAQAGYTGTPEAGTFATSTVTLPQLAGTMMNILTLLRAHGIFS